MEKDTAKTPSSSLTLNGEELEVIAVKISGSSLADPSALEWFSQTVLGLIDPEYTNSNDDNHKIPARRRAYVVVHGANNSTTTNNSNDTMHGLAATRRLVQKSNRMVVESLMDAGVNAVGLSPCFGGVRTVQGFEELRTRLDNVLRDTLEAGLVPIVHGDACLFSGGKDPGIYLGGTVLLQEISQLPWVHRVVVLTTEQEDEEDPPSLGKRVTIAHWGSESGQEGLGGKVDTNSLGSRQYPDQNAKGDNLDSFQKERTANYANQNAKEDITQDPMGKNLDYTNQNDKGDTTKKQTQEQAAALGATYPNQNAKEKNTPDPLEKNLDYANVARRLASASPGAFRVSHGNQNQNNPNQNNPSDAGTVATAPTANTNVTDDLNAPAPAPNVPVAPARPPNANDPRLDPVVLAQAPAARRPTAPGAMAVAGPGTPGQEEEPPAPQEQPPDEEAPVSSSDNNPPVSSNNQGDEYLLNARLVEDEPGEIVEARPALEGFAAIVRNRRFKFVAAAFLIVLLAVVVPVVVLVPGSAGDPVVITNNVTGAVDLTKCGQREVKQTNYRGTINYATNNLTCQRWDSQFPHIHRFYPDNYPAYGLEENYCRNPDNSDRAWCYTTDPEIRTLYCPVPYCNDTKVETNTKCGTFPGLADYRGTINVTASGKKCQRWNDTKPHYHQWQPENDPFAGLEENYCRNPDGEYQAWCYTEDPDTRWEVCEIPACGSGGDMTMNLAYGTNFVQKQCYNCTQQECGYASLKQRDYRGTINVTRGRIPCAYWGKPANQEIDHRNETTHKWSPLTHPHLDLDNNYCRNPSGEDEAAWCYTDHVFKAWDYCDVPFCEDDFRVMRFCGTKNTFQTDYRGDIKVSVSGKPCQIWNDAYEARKILHTVEHTPWAGLSGDFCRNPGPGDEHNRAWCYVEGDELWEFCDVPDCKPCGTFDKQDYRGEAFTTRSGNICQDWESKFPDATYSELKEYGLEYNLCRNPPYGNNGTKENVWCFTDPNTEDWDYCDVPECTEEAEMLGNTTCGSRSEGQQDYIGKINVTSSGKACQPWGSQFPHAHKYTPEIYPNSNLDENFCRQPDKSEASAWCLVDDPDLLWEYCDIPMCEDLASYSYQLQGDCGTLSKQQEDYRGNTNVTLSGYPCQAWSSQVPHPHRYSNLSHPFAGLEENFCRNPDGMEKAWCFTADPTKLWEYCSVPACAEPNQALYCGSASKLQADYRGTISTTESGLACQRWDSQSPHEHRNTPRIYPDAGLEENYCRNGDGEDRAWCYTIDRNKRWEFCDVPFCAETDDITNEECGLESLGQSDYRGKVNTTVGGITCQRWDSQFPHAHRNRPGAVHGAGLEENFCRNPYEEDRAWCYTMDPGVRWAYCDIPICEEHQSYCGTDSLGQADYRGTISTTRGGHTCQRWGSQTPQTHSQTVLNYPEAGLEVNYCRNPDGQAQAWCYTTKIEQRYDFCDVPSCREKDMPAQPNPQGNLQDGEANFHTDCGSKDLGQADYRGTVSSTQSGIQCQRWDSQSPHAHGQDLANPDLGLEENYCRNPDGEPMAWCYTVDQGTRWEFCNVPNCGAIEADLPGDTDSNTCGSTILKQADYRGTVSVTRSGRQCQHWDSQSPHAHAQVETYPDAGLEENYCRNPDGEARAWCYTSDPNMRWEFCDIPMC